MGAASPTLWGTEGLVGQRGGGSFEVSPHLIFDTSRRLRLGKVIREALCRVICLTQDSSLLGNKGSPE